VSGERPRSREIIDSVTERLTKGGIPADKAREIARRTRLHAEASDDGSDPAPIYRTPDQVREDQRKRFEERQRERR
jgi:hypothetical protein